MLNFERKAPDQLISAHCFLKFLVVKPLAAKLRENYSNIQLVLVRVFFQSILLIATKQETIWLSHMRQHSRRNPLFSMP